MKEILVMRLIELGKKTKRPGFERDKDFLFTKFSQVPDKDLLVLFELTVVESHQDGHQ